MYVYLVSHATLVSGMMIGLVMAVIGMSSGKDDGGTGEDKARITSSQISRLV